MAIPGDYCLSSCGYFDFIDEQGVPRRQDGGGGAHLGWHRPTGETYTAADDGSFGGPQMVSALSWSLIDPHQAGLQPGSSGVFEILAAAPPGPIVFAASDDTTDMNSLGFVDGTTMGPANPVPEPSSLVMGSSGLAALGGLAIRRVRGARP